MSHMHSPAYGSAKRWSITICLAYLVASGMQTVGAIGISLWAFGVIETLNVAQDIPLVTVSAIFEFFIYPIWVEDVVLDWWVWASYLAAIGAMVWFREPGIQSRIRNSIRGES